MNYHDKKFYDYSHLKHLEYEESRLGIFNASYKLLMISFEVGLSYHKCDHNILGQLSTLNIFS